MTQTIGMRAASMATSAAVLGLIVAAALSVSITLQTNTSPPPWTIPVYTLPPDPPPPPETTRREEPPPQPPTEDATVFDADPPPLPPVETIGTTPSELMAPIGPAQITNPRWLRQPRDLERYYPARALARGVTGQAVLDCLVDVAGALRCSVVSETPESWGFGAAAVRISEDYRMVPAMRGGQAVQGRYRMRVPFEMR
jgi:protein TonB